MTRLAIVVEGQTEREFVDHILAEYLSFKGVYPRAVSLRGNVTVHRLASEIAKLHPNFDCVSSLVDFYGFRDKGNLTPDELEERIGETVSSINSSYWSATHLIPYVQRHEFEGLLFSRVESFDTILASENDIRQLHEIRSNFQTPEDINDSPITAPSKRIGQIIPRYNKVANGRLIVESVGLDTIRAECPRFNEWLGKLESLGNNPPQNQ